MLDVYFGIGIAILIVAVVGAAVFLFIIGLLDEQWEDALVYASQCVTGGLILAAAWPLIGLVALALPAFILWGGFNLARAAKHKSFDRSDWR